jgi:hypothetical protein
MKRLIFAAYLACAASAAHAECGNVLHNIMRSRECEAYSGPDWTKIKDMRDARTAALQEWMDKYAGSGRSLELILKDADIRRSHSLTRDTQIFGSDADMWKARGCAELPLCVKPKIDASENPTPLPPKQVRDLEDEPAPKAKPAPRNSRTGGNYCGPRDRARGYCR